MKPETMEKVESALQDSGFLEALPLELAGFTLRELHVPNSSMPDMYDIFCYDRPADHRCVTAYFHEETQEYKLRIRVGYVEFCRIEYITADLAAFTARIHSELPALLDGLVHFQEETLSVLFRQKNILTWPYSSNLPGTLEGYTLFIRPSAPVKITNGSYIIIDYVDFTHACEVTIYYNLYRDEFFGEARIHAIPDVTYDFDARSLDGLQKNLETQLVPHMRDARLKADAQAEKLRQKQEAAQKELVTQEPQEKEEGKASV